MRRERKKEVGEIHLFSLHEEIPSYMRYAIGEIRGI